MFNKLSFKIIALFTLTILTYLMSIIFIAMPKIEDYVYESETRNVKSQLERVSSIVNSKSKILETFTELSLKNHKDRIKDIAQVGNNILSSYNDRYQRGEMPLEVAKEIAFNEINKIRYGQNDYFYILDKKGILVQHPDSRFFGQNIYNQADVKGKLFVQEQMKNASKNGHTYTRYYWVKDKKDQVLEKLSYTTYFKPWDIYVSTGLYIDDIQKSINVQKDNIKEEILKIIDSTKLAKTGYIYLISSDDKTILNPKNHLGDKNPLTTDMLKESFKTKKEIILHQKRGLTKKEKIAWVEYNKFYDWYIVATVFKEDLYYMAKSINNIILSISFLVLSFLFIIGIKYIRKMIHPIEILSKNALAIQQGDLTVRNKIQTNDEIGVLAEQLNFMVDDIESHVKNLEEKVEKRTRELNDKLYYDDLTKLLNKYALLEELGKHESATVLMLDIEAFDDINELYSYHVGNIVLKEYSKFLQKFCQNKTYELFRLYGNTFALLDKGGMLDFMKYEKDITELVESTKYYKVNVEEIHLDIDIDVTMGVSIYQDNALKKANNALKNAKKNHKRFVVYNSTLNTDEMIENIKLWREQIKDAIEKDKIVPFYQPIYNREKEILKYETLMRMKEVNEKGEIKYLSPFFFLEIATKTKQYARLSEMVIRKALMAASKGNYTISINLGFSDIEDPKILDLLDEYFNKSTAEFCSRVVFEILESDHISDYEMFEEFIERYKSLGIRFAIDDFGTGYSNFTHILRIRPDYIKIDGSLIKNIATDKDSLGLVKSIIRLSQELNIKTIAEFVHNEEVFNIVHELGVDEFQGYYLCEPKINI